MPTSNDGRSKAEAEAEGSVAAAEQLARLYRSSLGDGLALSTRTLLKRLLLEELGALPAALTPSTNPVEAVASQHPAPAEPLDSTYFQTQPPVAQDQPSTHLTPRLDTVGGNLLAAQSVTTVLGSSFEQLDVRLRHLVEADAPWSVLEPVAIALYKKRRDAEAAARVIELAFLSAETPQLVELIARFKGENPGFYRALHPSVRLHLVLRLWLDGTKEVIGSLLYREREAAFLLPIERLFIFLAMAEAKDAATPFMYGQRFFADLMQGTEEHGERLGLAPGQLRLRLGRMALDLGYHAEAVQLLEPIGDLAPERDEALRLLLQTTVDKHKAGRGSLVEKIMAEPSSLARLEILSQMLHQTRELGGFKDRNRPALNELLADPLAWLGEEPEIWGALSDLLTAHRDLEPLLPQLFQVFRMQAAKFHAPALDLALWQGPARKHAPTSEARYWRGVALMHYYVNGGATCEAELWQAHNLLAQAQGQLATTLPVIWKDLHKASFTWVARSHYILEVERARMLRQLRIAAPAGAVTLADLEDYVGQEGTAPIAVLASMQALSEAKQAPALASRYLLRRAQQTHLINADLNRIWQLANERQEPDLAWRAATVLQARGGLCTTVRHAWDISGEKRAQYGFTVPSRAMLDLCLAGMTPAAARLAHACVQVGGILPELLAILDPGAVPIRSLAHPAASVEAQVDKALLDIDWIPVAKRRYRFSFESALGGTALPAFMQVLPGNAWSLLTVRLAERLGINAWGWRLSRLQAQIIDLIPRLASRQDLRRHSGRVATWLKELRPEQRAAWQDLATLTRTLDDQEAALALASFICRLATVILQNHLAALTSLQTMRAHVAMIWDLEVWLLGEPYSKIRAACGRENRVLVPSILQRLPTIVAPSAAQTAE